MTLLNPPYELEFNARISMTEVISAKRKMKDIVKLPTGKTDNADKKYENYVVQLLASLLYPHLDFAEGQSRTDSGAQIRDLIFYNNQSIPFFKEIYETIKHLFMRTLDGPAANMADVLKEWREAKGISKYAIANCTSISWHWY